MLAPSTNCTSKEAVIHEWDNGEFMVGGRTHFPIFSLPRGTACAVRYKYDMYFGAHSPIS